MAEINRMHLFTAKLSDCHFTELCPNLKSYAFQNSTLQHIYAEAYRCYIRGDWVSANNHLEKMIRFLKEFTPAMILKKKIGEFTATNPSLHAGGGHQIELMIN